MNSSGLINVIDDSGISRSTVKRFLISTYKNLALIVLFVTGLLLNGDVTPLTKRGFFCNDSSINYPFKRDTIGIKTLFFFALILPAIVIKICDKTLKRKLLTLSPAVKKELNGFPRKVRKISGNVLEVDVEEEELISDPLNVKRRNRAASYGDLSEIINDNDSNRNPDFDDNPEFEQIPSDDIDQDDDDDEINLFTRIPLDSDQELSNNFKAVNYEKTNNLSIYRNFQKPFGDFQLFFFGLCTTMIFTGLGKITCGRYRPHFLKRCQPDVDCTNLEYSNKYIENFRCTNAELRPRDNSYITTSWPSGHASIMFYSMIYLIIYLNTVIPLLFRLSSREAKKKFDLLSLYAIYVLMIGLAGYIAMTRVSDYHHHATDVLSGSVIGTLIALGLSKSLSGIYLYEL